MKSASLQKPSGTADTHRLAREFWERSVLAMCVDGGETAVRAADILLDEWRKRFDPPKKPAPIFYNPKVTTSEEAAKRYATLRYGSCDCWKHPQQVCDICQGWTGNEKDADPPKE